jgi:hypothetical protein
MSLNRALRECLRLGVHLQFPPPRRWAVQGQEPPETCFETGHATVEFSGCRSRSAGLAACLRQRRVPGCAPGGAVTFSCVAKRKSPKRRRPRCPRRFLGSEPQFTEPAARPKGAVLRTAVKWVSDPNNRNLRCALQAGSAQTRFTAFRSNSARP